MTERLPSRSSSQQTDALLDRAALTGVRRSNRRPGARRARVRWADDDRRVAPCRRSRARAAGAVGHCDAPGHAHVAWPRALRSASRLSSSRHRRRRRPVTRCSRSRLRGDHLYEHRAIGARRPDPLRGSSAVAPTGRPGAVGLERRRRPGTTARPASCTTARSAPRPQDRDDARRGSANDRSTMTTADSAGRHPGARTSIAVSAPSAPSAAADPSASAPPARRPVRRLRDADAAQPQTGRRHTAARVTTGTDTPPPRPPAPTPADLQRRWCPTPCTPRQAPDPTAVPVDPARLRQPPTRRRPAEPGRVADDTAAGGTDGRDTATQDVDAPHVAGGLATDTRRRRARTIGRMDADPGRGARTSSRPSG